VLQLAMSLGLQVGYQLQFSQEKKNLITQKADQIMQLCTDHIRMECVIRTLLEQSTKPGGSRVCGAPSSDFIELSKRTELFRPPPQGAARSFRGLILHGTQTKKYWSEHYLICVRYR
jgi:hypothetical protein